MIRIPRDRKPTHPSEMLKEEFLEPMGIRPRQLAEAIGVSYQRVNEIVNGRLGITPSAALRLAKSGQVSPDFWLNLQIRHDLSQVSQKESDRLHRSRTCSLIPLPSGLQPIDDRRR